MAEDRTPACCLRPVRQKTIEGSVIQSDFVNVPKKFDSHIFISRSKACYLGRKPSTSKVAGDFKACVPEAWQSVSALHAILRWKDGKVTIEDRSSNGSWVGRAGKGAGESEEDFKRLDKNKAEEVAMDSYVMLAQWPSGRKAEDVLMCDQMLSCVSTGSERPICSRSYLYKLEAVPSEAGPVKEKQAVASAVAAPSAPSSGLNNSTSFGRTPSSTTNMEPCKVCQAHSQEVLRTKEVLANEKTKHDKTRKDKEKADKELILLKKETENMKKAATEAKKTSQNEKKRIEQAAHAKKAEVDAELLSAKKLLKELTASRDHLREGVAPLLSTIKKLREQNNQNRTELAEMDSLFTADVQSLDEVMKTHTLSKGNEALLKEHEQEITSMQQDQRRVEREAAAWRLKAEAYATKLPDELNRVLNSHLPNLVQECIEKVHSRVIALNSATASQLFGPEASAGLALTQGGEVDEERAVGAELSQRTVVSSHLGGANGTPDLPTPMTCDGDAAPRTAGPDTQLRSNEGAGGASVSFRDLVNSQAASPGGLTVAGPAADEKTGRSSQVTDGSAKGGLKRPELAAEAGDEGDGKRRRVGSARGGPGAKDDSPENHSQVNVNANDISNGNGKADGEKAVENGGEKARSQHAEAPEASPAMNQSGGSWAGDETNGRSADLMKKLAALPKSHEGMDF